MPGQQATASEDDADAASVALVVDGRVLLIQRAFEPLKGLWTLPGGRREPGEAIEATAIREIGEELGLRVAGLMPVTTLGVADRFLLQVFATRAFAGVIVPSPEIADHRWVAPHELGDLATTPGLAAVLAQAMARLGSG